jgi:hypothetical protein
VQTNQLDRIEQKLDRLLALLQKQSAPKKVKQTDEEWLAETKQAYHWVDWPTELTKMQTWLALPKNKGRKMTRDFITNWINKCPAPVQVKVPVTVPPVYTKKVEKQAPGVPCPPEYTEKLSRVLGREWGKM